MTIPKALYIDDSEEEIARDVQRLNQSRRLLVEYLAPPKNLELTEEFSHASLFFVDWFLDEQGAASAVNYRGRTLATHLREKMPDKPIILLTKEQFVDPKRARGFINNLNLFNGYIGKHEVSDDVEKVISQTLCVINGFERLNSAPKTKEGFYTILGAEGDVEGTLLGAADPPLGGVQDENELSSPAAQKTTTSYHWTVAGMASWIQNVFLAYPGIVYDPLFAATYLGITKDAFLRSEIQEIFQTAKYIGAFASEEGHWWRGRLIRQAIAYLRSASIQEAPNTGFAEAFFKTTGQTLPLNTCVYSKEQPADWVCYILGEPVKQEYSLVYHPDGRPSVMEDARVSFTAIRESNEVNEERFDKSSKALLEEIREQD